MGPGSVFTARLGHLLLLHLEGSQVHWQGKYMVLLSYTVFIAMYYWLCFSLFIQFKSCSTLELAELPRTDLSTFIIAVSS